MQHLLLIVKKSIRPFFRGVSGYSLPFPDFFQTGNEHVWDAVVVARPQEENQKDVRVTGAAAQVVATV